MILRTCTSVAIMLFLSLKSNILQRLDATSAICFLYTVFNHGEYRVEVSVELM